LIQNQKHIGHHWKNNNRRVHKQRILIKMDDRGRMKTEELRQQINPMKMWLLHLMALKTHKNGNHKV
jgi:hypothetical protein